MGGVEARYANVGHGGEELRAPEGHEQTKRGSGKRQREAFGEQLAEDACATGAGGDANGHLALAAGGAREEEVRGVGASDEEKERDGSEHHEQDGANVADQRIDLRLQAEGQMTVGVGELFFQRDANCGRVVIGLLHREAWRQAADDIQEVRTTLFGHGLVIAGSGIDQARLARQSGPEVARFGV